ncbi:hypothetical protein [Lentzea aerocolonigenes]|nr:hypothetical protein [Lentzea aerocolonigenes]MCP2250775.1 hypothetical protein [Lentzea aerocolonigenes]
MNTDGGFDGLYVWAQSASDMFTDVEGRVIDFEYFRPYFDQVGLPLELAKSCLVDVFDKNARKPASDPFVKFVPLSVLTRYERLPSYHEVADELVDHRDVPGFALQGRLSWWGGTDLSASPCVFVSHRWQTEDHPDPTGSELRRIVERLAPARKRRWFARSAGEMYLWIDFCCLPQRTGGPLAPGDEEDFRAGLASLAEVVKNCDLLVLDSPDYLDRAWCYAEILVWLCKIAEIHFTRTDSRTNLFRTVQTRHLVKERGRRSDTHHRDVNVVTNLRFRGFAGSDEDLLAIYQAVYTYCNNMADSAQYHIAGGSRGFDYEYLPTVVNFLCTTWLLLRGKQAADPDDIQVCLRIIIEALKFST